jgi:hypothetical protein
MKYLIFLLIFSFFTLPVQAQRSSGSRIFIDASQIPDSVKNSQNKLFAGISVSRWEEHISKSPGKGGKQYIASFTDPNGVRVRARYTSQGKNMSVSRFYVSAKLPAVVTTAVQRYAGYKAMGAEEIKSTEKQKTYYKVRLRNEAGSRTVVLDEKGDEVSKGNSDVEIEPEEGDH